MAQAISPTCHACRGSGDFHDLGQALQKMANELQARNTALAESEARFRQLSDASFEAIILHENGRITDANAAADRLMGVAPGGLVGTAMLSWVSPFWSAPFSAPRRAWKAFGKWTCKMQRANHPLRMQRTPPPAGQSPGARGGGARHPHPPRGRGRNPPTGPFRRVTGLSNRRSLLEQVVQELAAADLQPRRAALPPSTSTPSSPSTTRSAWPLATPCAHHGTAAERAASQGQRLARVDGDTFALLLCDLQGDLNQASAEAARTIERLLAAIAEPLEVQGQVLHLSAGAGVVMIPNDSRDAPELLREAETAMHRARMRATAACTFSPMPCRKPPANAWRCAATCAERWKPSPRRCCCTTSRRWTARAAWPVWSPWCAGRTRAVAWCRPCISSPKPKPAA